MKFMLAVLLVAFSSQTFAKAKKSKMDEKSHAAMVYFEEPQDGAKVPAKFKVKMGIMGLDVKPAGDKTPKSGHHHLIVDGQPIAKGAAIPVSPTYIHYGKGQTEAEVELKPGKHTLTLQFADLNHISYGPELSSTITVTVE